MLTRRQVLELGAAVTVLPTACRSGTRPGPVLLNDVHSRLNPTRVTRVARPRSLPELETLCREAQGRGEVVSIAGGRHAMGGQQFGTDTLHVDTRGLDRVLAFDPEAGTIEVEAGIEWPALIDWCVGEQQAAARHWGIRQKQTGADRLTVGGALASNVHGRGLRFAPIVGDVASFTLVDAEGRVQHCSREQNTELFGLVIGGYGLFGVVYSVVLQLAPRRKIERVVEVRGVEGLDEAFAKRIADGFLYGDFQFKTDENASDYLQTGVFSCYRPLADNTAIARQQRRLPRWAWKRLLELAHYDKARAFEEYADYYLSTDGQIYWSDTHQLAYYLDGYHEILDRSAKSDVAATEMISEVYVPRSRLATFLQHAATAFREARIDLIYGTVRLIEADTETFLPWARQPWACVVFNLHVRHSPDGIARAQRQFRLLIDLALEEGGSYFLTYHRWASRAQVETCYPEMVAFLRQKLARDPDERFQSDWYRHYREMFAGDLLRT